MNKIFEYFQVRERGSRPGVELVAGVTTFMTMAYIIFLQPAILSGALTGQPTGMDAKALLVTTCLASAAGTILMGLLANYPIALAPGMGENFFFVSVVGICTSSAIGLQGDAAWQTALAVVFVSGVIFLIITAMKIRKMIMNVISPNLQYAIAGGIGIFIALIGFKSGGLVLSSSNGMFLTQNIHSKTLLIFAIGLASTSILHVLKIRGSILWGILIGAAVALMLGKIHAPQSLISMPPDISPVFAKMDFANLMKHFAALLPFILIFTVMDVFDTLGTLVGVGTQAGLMKGNQLPRCERAFAADACATVFGALCGHSTVTSYIESASGVEQGGRTGLTAIVTGFCFIAAIFFTPVIGVIANYPEACNPITAPALVLVGAMMLKNVSKIDWDDYSESIPAFLILIGIPFTSSISDGLAIGLIIYPLIKLFSGKIREISWLTYLIGIILVAYLFFFRTGG